MKTELRHVSHSLHGDVILKSVKSIPEGAKPEAAPDVLGWGEVAGAAHRITEGKFEFGLTSFRWY